MAEQQYEHDEWGGHKEIKGSRINEDGIKVNFTKLRMFGCAGGCPASFYTNDARVAHIKAMHPGVHSGPTEDMIQLARIQPDLAESFGIDRDQLYEPMNVEEFKEQDRIQGIMNFHEKNAHKISSHPAWVHYQGLMSSARMLEATQRANATRDWEFENLDTSMERIHAHAHQFVAGLATGQSVRDPRTHAHELSDELDNVLNGLPKEQYQYHDREITKHFNKMFDAGFNNGKPSEYPFREVYDGKYGWD